MHRDQENMKLQDTIRFTLKEVTENHLKIGSAHAWDRDIALSILSGEQFIGIPNDGMQLVYDLAAKVYELRPFAKELFSEKFIIDHIVESIRNIVSKRPDASLDVEVERLRDAFSERRDHWTTVIPVENLTTDQRFSISKVHIYPGLEGSIEVIMNDLKMDPLKPRFPPGIGLEHLLKGRKEFSFAAIESEAAEPDMAVSNALSILEVELSLLRLMNPSRFFGIPGGYPTGDRDMILYCRETDGMSGNFTTVGALVPFRVRAREIGYLNDDKLLRRIGDTLRKNERDRTELEDRLVLALTWYGKSTLHIDQREAILDALIGMEAILLDKFEAAKKETLAERSAFLLADGGRQRLDIYRRVAKICDVRNDIAHNGLLAVSQNDAKEAIYITRLLVFRIADLLDRMTKFEQFRDHILELKFSLDNTRDFAPRV